MVIHLYIICYNIKDLFFNWKVLTICTRARDDIMLLIETYLQNPAVFLVCFWFWQICKYREHFLYNFILRMHLMFFKCRFLAFFLNSILNIHKYTYVQRKKNKRKQLTLVGSEPTDLGVNLSYWKTLQKALGWS